MIWFVAGCLQAYLMDLHPDEAYFWQMSRFMDWGYFHHPPMIAAFIKVGYWLMPNELGVRFMTVVTSTLGVPILYKLSRPKDAKTFLLVYLGLILTHAGVFFAAPDSALIFFTLIFLALFKKYLEKDSYTLAIFLAVVVATLMYSKYHAIVLLASVLIAVPRLFLRPSFWLVVVISVALFMPHVFWQFDHDLISYKFNWVIREKKVWDITVFLDYLLGQLIILGPVGIILIISIFKSKIISQFDRVLIFVTVGVFTFFLLMSLRGKVEANWTAIAILPLIILGARNIANLPKLQRVLKPVAMTFGVLLIVARCYLMSPWSGIGLPTVFPLQGWEEWAQVVKSKADGKPVFFSNSYQWASQYSFYSGEQGYHFSALNYNGNQFEIWDFDKAVYGEKASLILGSSQNVKRAIDAPGFKTMYQFEIDNYRSYRNLRFEFENSQVSARAGTNLELSAEIVNRTQSQINLDSLIVARPVMMFYYFNGEQSKAEIIICEGCIGILSPGESKPVSFNVQVPSQTGKHFIRFGLDFIMEMPEQNSDFIKLKVAK